MTTQIRHRELRSAAGPSSLDVEARTCTFVASTDAIDSYDEIVEQTWDLTRFKANPVILFGHNSRELPIGQATFCDVVDGELVVTVKFATAAANPKAEQVWQSVKEGTLRAVSVGFYPRSIRAEKRDGKEVYVLSQNELHEISLTPVPANADCVARSADGPARPTPLPTLAVERPTLQTSHVTRTDITGRHAVPTAPRGPTPHVAPRCALVPIVETPPGENLALRAIASTQRRLADERTAGVVASERRRATDAAMQPDLVTATRGLSR